MIKNYNLFVESFNNTVPKVGDRVTVKPPKAKTSYRGIVTKVEDDGTLVWEDSKGEEWSNNIKHITHINRQRVVENYEEIMKNMADEIDVTQIEGAEKEITTLRDNIEQKKEQLEKELENLEKLEVETFTDDNKDTVEEKKAEIKDSIEKLKNDIESFEDSIKTLKDKTSSLKEE